MSKKGTRVDLLLSDDEKRRRCVMSMDGNHDPIKELTNWKQGKDKMEPVYKMKCKRCGVTL